MTRTGQRRDHAAEAVFRAVVAGEQRAGDRGFAALREAALMGLKANTTTVRMPSSSAPSTAQIAATDDTCVVSGLAMPGSEAVWVSP